MKRLKVPLIAVVVVWSIYYSMVYFTHGDRDHIDQDLTAVDLDKIRVQKEERQVVAVKDTTTHVHSTRPFKGEIIVNDTVQSVEKPLKLDVVKETIKSMVQNDVVQVQPQPVERKTATTTTNKPVVLSIHLGNITDVRFVSNAKRTYIPSIPAGTAPPRIPHIIHQTWDDNNVPQQFAEYIKSWLRNHPTWEYWFWTPASVKTMLEKYYPEHLNTYSNYSEEIFKANLMRYFIMHKYGGVYADLDLESLRPLDNWTMDNDCILSENNYVHGYIIRPDSKRSEVMITFLASRPGHPYFKKAIDMLPSYQAMPYNHKLLYADKVYVEYLKSQDSQTPGGIVTTVHPDFFLPTYDRGWTGKVRKVCYPPSYQPLSSILKRACDTVKDSTGGRQAKSYSYANHYWEHVIMWGKKKEAKPKVPIQQLVPSVKNLTLLLSSD